MATYTGTDKDNILNGSNAGDYMEGLGGNDTLNGLGGEDQIYGGDGNDILNGGTGNDSLIGGNGNDTYLIAKNDGQDIIYNDDLIGTDVVKFTDVASTEVKIIRDSQDQLIFSYGANSSLRIFDFFASAGSVVDQFKFTDGVTWNVANIRAKVLQATNGDDYLKGYDGEDNTISGLAGNDWIYGANKNDTLSGGLGDDTLSGLAGDDLIQGDDGKDNMYGGDGNDRLEGGQGNDNLSGEKGDDVLVGGVGNDVLDGGSGADVYLIASNDGQDTIYNLDSDSSVDTVKYADVALIDITDINLSGKNLIVQAG